jgi:hypothetical protein
MQLARDNGESIKQTRCARAVPLDPRAVYALQHSALDMDIYLWLAHRLCRIFTDNGVKLCWERPAQPVRAAIQKPEGLQESLCS